MFPSPDLTRGSERPHTTHSVKSRDVTRASIALTSERSGESADYEWPDLPPISEIKNAICRQRVSKGLSYLLPVDKTKNSVDGVYRTDLRVTFKGGYRADDDSGRRFNDSRVRASTKHHFQTNTIVTYFRPESVPAISRRVNSESERALAEYAKSAPRTGISGRRTLGHFDNLRQRSQLYLPPHSHVPPEVIKLRQEAEKIVKSVLEKESPHGEAQLPVGLTKRRRRGRQPPRARSRGHVLFAETDTTHGDDSDEIREPTVIDNVKLIRKASRFRNYDELKQLKIDAKRKTPATVQSQYLSTEKNDDVWNWLHCGLPANEFNYFLELCA